MQSELLAGNSATRIRLGAVNQIGAEGSAEDMSDGCDIPLLQDTYDDHAWAQWQVTYRDVIILDEENRHYSQRASQLYWGLALTDYFCVWEEPLELTGANRDGEVDVRSIFHAVKRSRQQPGH